MKINIGDYPKADGEERRVKVRIDGQDLWSLDHTLALIIHPALLRLREAKGGSPFVCNRDVPMALRNPNPDNWEIDGLWHERWRSVLDEMIWTFNEIINEWSDGETFDAVKWRKREKRVNNGLRLFGKYYRALWM